MKQIQPDTFASTKRIAPGHFGRWDVVNTRTVYETSENQINLQSKRDIMKPKFISYIIFVLIFLMPSILTINFLIDKFPYTGLARVLAIPSMLVINIMIITFYLLKKRNPFAFRNYMYWIGIILLTITVTIGLYPQEYKPHVVIQIWEQVK